MNEWCSGGGSSLGAATRWETLRCASGQLHSSAGWQTLSRSTPGTSVMRISFSARSDAAICSAAHQSTVMGRLSKSSLARRSAGNEENHMAQPYGPHS